MATMAESDVYGSEMVVEFPCYSCLKDNKHVESMKFCVQCKDYLCQTCLNYHAKFSSTSTHKVVDKSKVLVPEENVMAINVRFTPDSSATRDIQGICVVTRGNNQYALLTDWHNKMVKVLDMKDMRVICAVKLKKKPYGVCEVPSSGLIVVTVRDADELAILDFHGYSLTFSDVASQAYLNVKVPTFSRGIAVMSSAAGDNLLVLDGGNMKRDDKKATLSVYTSAVKTLDGPEVNYPIYMYSEALQTPSFWCFPKNIAVSKDNKQLFITDESIGVIVTDTKGKMTGIIQNPALRGARGICADDNGNLYVSGIESSNVVKFSADGKFIGEVVNASHGLTLPLSLCYYSKTQSLLVGCRGVIPLLIVKL